MSFVELKKALNEESIPLDGILESQPLESTLFPAPRNRRIDYFWNRFLALQCRSLDTKMITNYFESQIWSLVLSNIILAGMLRITCQNTCLLYPVMSFHYCIFFAKTEHTAFISTQAHMAKNHKWSLLSGFIHNNPIGIVRKMLVLLVEHCFALPFLHLWSESVLFLDAFSANGPVKTMHVPSLSLQTPLSRRTSVCLMPTSAWPSGIWYRWAHGWLACARLRPKLQPVPCRVFEDSQWATTWDINQFHVDLI